jgi:hypothetical protein
VFITGEKTNEGDMKYKRLLCSEKLKKTKEVVDNTLINNFLHLYKIEIGGDNCKSHF